MKPRTLINIDTYDIGGAGRVILQFLRHGGKELCDPLIAGFWRGPEGKWQFREAVEAMGVKFAVLNQKCAFDPLVIQDLVKIVRENNIDILESHGYKAHVVCMAVKKLTKVHWIAYVHGWTSENRKVSTYNFIEKTIIRFADRIVPVSESLKARLHLGRKADKKAIVIPNAADFVESEQNTSYRKRCFGVDKDDIFIGVIGRLSPEKGHRFFIEAFRIVAEKNVKVKAVFVGEGQEREAITRAIGAHGLQNKIILAGYQEDMAAIYGDLDIVVLPSLAEGMPNVALEAMMHAKPVIASHIGGIPEVVINGETGYLVEPQNPPALAEALEVLICNDQMRRAFGLAGRQRVITHFDPRTRTQKVMGIYKHLLEL